MQIVKSAQRVFEILELFEEVRQPMSLKEVCEHLHYPASSASALLKSLVVLGYVDFDKPSRTYMPTMRLSTLGNWVQDTLFSDDEVYRIMQSLSDLFGETVTLAVQSDLFIQYVYLIPSRLPIWYSIPIGMVRPITESGIGWLMLSKQPDRRIDIIVSRVNQQRLASRERISTDVLKSHINTVRDQGYVFSKHTLEKGAGCIAMLLPWRPFQRVFAIGIHGPVQRLEEKSNLILTELRRCVSVFD